jgi:sterol desaturase/sphingolipid hydroxylase (fatty acid hydroxylase superfamily)
MPAPELPDIVQLAVPFFIGSMVLELIIGRLTGRARYETRDTTTSLLMGGGNLVEGLLVGGLIGGLYQATYAVAPVQLGTLSWGWSLPVFVLCFVLDDLRYYWFHRLSHEHRWLWASHVNHHSSQHYNLSTALRQTWLFTLTLGFVFRVPLVFLGFDPKMVAFVGGINLVYQFWIHTELIGRLPRWFEAVFNTPSHHRVHHATNPRYLDSNYAGVFIVWDKLFGSFVPEQDEAPPRYGLVHDIGTFSLWRAVLHEYLAMWSDALQPGLRLRDRLGYLFGPPGWSHDGSRLTSTARKALAVQQQPELAGRPGLPST